MGVFVKLSMKITNFWDEHKHENISNRPALTQSFIDEWCSKFGDENEATQLLRKKALRHPLIRRKAKYNRDYSALEILADFIINADMVDERKRDNPVYNAEANFYRYSWRRKHQVSYDAMTEELETFGTDDIDYRPQVRRERSISEQLAVEANVESRYRERWKRYKKYILPGKVVSYNLNETGGIFITDSFVNSKKVLKNYLLFML